MTTANLTDGSISVEDLATFFGLLEAGLGISLEGADGETSADRILRLANEIESGERTAQDVLDSLLLDAFNTAGLSSQIGNADAPQFETDATAGLVKDADDAERIAGDLISGDTTIDDLVRSLQGVIDQRIAAGDVTVVDPGTGLPIGGGEDSVIPADATLVKITDPTGSDSSVRYAVVYEAFGVQFSFNIGDVVDFDALFPSGTDLFENVQTLTQQQFDESGFVDSGSLDAAGLIGRNESFTSLIELQVEQVVGGDLPGWLRDDAEAMALVASGAAQGWDPGRTWVELSQTDAFKTRFSAFDQFKVEGETIQATLDRLVVAEESLIAAIQRHRPNGFEITTDYLQEVLARGHDPATFGAVLEAEKVLLNNPGSLENLNAILLASGLDPTDELGMLGAMVGAAPDEVVEAINTAGAQQALIEAGFEGVDVESLVDIIEDISAVRTADDFAQVATSLAQSAATNFAELEQGDFGLTREELVATFFNEDPTEIAGRGRGEVLNLLTRFERDRRAASQGFSANQGFADRSGNFVIQGLGGL